MNILVIKQTSLGDVLHATPHLRAIKARYPKAHLTVLTAEHSAEIYVNNPHIDRLVLFDYARFKQLGLKSPIKLVALIKQTLAEINSREYDLAFDLQGLLRSVVFLYFTRAQVKYVKGRWLGLRRFRNKQLHAIDEMTALLTTAQIPVKNNTMEFACNPAAQDELRSVMLQHSIGKWLEQPPKKPFILISPFTRWQSKDWPLERYIKLAVHLAEHYRVVLTATMADADKIQSALNACPGKTANISNLAGELSITTLAQLIPYAGLVISGDSFPMHLATAVGTPIIALFGPTDERKTGPRTNNSVVLRPADCQRCDKPYCQRACLAQIKVSTVMDSAKQLLNLDSSVDRD